MKTSVFSSNSQSFDWSWPCPGTYAPSVPHLIVSLYLCTSVINERDEVERRVSSKSPSRVQNREERVAGGNGGQKCFPKRGHLLAQRANQWLFNLLDFPKIWMLAHSPWFTWWWVFYGSFEFPHDHGWILLFEASVWKTTLNKSWLDVWHQIVHHFLLTAIPIHTSSISICHDSLTLARDGQVIGSCKETDNTIKKLEKNPHNLNFYIYYNRL